MNLYLNFGYIYYMKSIIFYFKIYLIVSVSYKAKNL
jgi:hypothetical protein